MALNREKRALAYFKEKKRLLTRMFRTMMDHNLVTRRLRKFDFRNTDDSGVADGASFNICIYFELKFRNEFTAIKMFGSANATLNEFCS